MVKCTVGAGGVLLGASGMGVSKMIAVGALGVSVSLGRFLDLEPFGEEEEGREEDGNVVGVNGDNHRSGLLVEPNSSALVKIQGMPIVTSFALWMDFLMKSRSWSSSSGRMWVGID